MSARISPVPIVSGLGAVRPRSSTRIAFAAGSLTPNGRGLMIENTTCSAAVMKEAIKRIIVNTTPLALKTLKRPEDTPPALNAGRKR